MVTCSHTGFLLKVSGKMRWVNFCCDWKQTLLGIFFCPLVAVLNTTTMPMVWSGLQLSVESDTRLLWFCLTSEDPNECLRGRLALWLVKKARATISTNQKSNQTQWWLARPLSPALNAGYMYFLWVLIGLLCCLRQLWLVIVIYFWLWFYSIANRSIVISYIHLQASLCLSI